MDADLPSLALRALPMIERTGSMTRTAQELGVSQPAVSRAVAELERRIDVAVIARGRTPLGLTVEGARLARLAENEQQLRADALRDVERLRTRRDGLVRIGSFGPSASTRLLPTLFARFSRRCPTVSVAVREIHDVDLLPALRDGIIDVAVSLDPGEDDVEALPLGQDALVALLPESDGPIDAVTAKVMASRPFIMTKGGSEPLVRGWFALAGLTPDVRHEIQQVTSILAFVRSGLGVSIVAEYAAPEHHPGVRIAALNPPVPRPLSLVRRSGTPPSEAAAAFWKMVERDAH